MIMEAMAKSSSDFDLDDADRLAEMTMMEIAGTDSYVGDGDDIVIVVHVNCLLKRGHWQYY